MTSPWESILRTLATRLWDYEKEIERIRSLPTVALQEMSTIKVGSLLQGAIPTFGAKVQWRQQSRWYWATTQTGMETIIAWEWPHDYREAFKYLDAPETRLDSCDYWANLLRVLAGLSGVNTVGVVIDDSTAHAYNLVLTLDQPPQVYDWQQEKWGHLGEGLYKLEAGLILL